MLSRNIFKYFLINVMPEYYKEMSFIEVKVNLEEIIYLRLARIPVMYLFSPDRLPNGKALRSGPYIY